MGDESRVEKRPREVDGSDGEELKRTKTHEEEFDELFEDGYFDEPVETPEESARKEFVSGLSENGFRVTEEELLDLLSALKDKVPSWGVAVERRCLGLFLGCIARSTRSCRIAFVAQDGLKLIGQVLKEAVERLEANENREEAGMLVLACLACLKALPLGRASLWEHRQSIGKPFDGLHKWCASQKSALAAELRAPTLELCARWRRQPKPAAQEQSPEDKAMRRRVVDLISQGLSGLGAPSPTSPQKSPVGPLPSPAQLPNNLVAAEVENLLWGRYGRAKAHEYRHHARMLRTNLSNAGNAELRARVLSGELKPEELVSMDSNALAPEDMRKRRQEAQEKAMKESIVEELVPLRGDGVSDNDHFFDRGADQNTAPAVWVSPSKEKNREEKEKKEQEAAALPMLPPPTPFTMTVPAPAPVDVSTIEIMPTPGPDDDDEDELSVLRFLSAAPFH